MRSLARHASLLIPLGGGTFVVGRRKDDEKEDEKDEQARRGYGGDAKNNFLSGEIYDPHILARLRQRI